VNVSGNVGEQVIPSWNPGGGTGKVHGRGFSDVSLIRPLRTGRG